ncbi:MAG: HEPN domain-containing protein [Firmicutes bacterium]|nr:HEPN domain-containing protein [Bacillota bacterium]
MPPFGWNEFNRWIAQADHTLASARRDLEHGDFVWACFKAQQAAEYAVKGLARGFGLPATGHAITRLLKEISTEGVPVAAEQLQDGRLLDRHYIPPRYPDAYTEGSPMEFYDEPTAEAALAAAERIVEAVRRWMQEYRGFPEDG